MSLELGCDCLGHIHYFDATLSDSKGAPRAFCSYHCQHSTASLNCAVNLLQSYQSTVLVEM